MTFPTWPIGVGLAVVSAIISNLGLNLQKRNHLKNSAKVKTDMAASEATTGAVAGHAGHGHSHGHVHKHSHKHKHHKHSHKRKHRVQPNDILIRTNTGADTDTDTVEHTPTRPRSKRKRSSHAHLKNKDLETALLNSDSNAESMNGSFVHSASEVNGANGINGHGTTSDIQDLLSSSSSFITSASDVPSHSLTVNGKGKPTTESPLSPTNHDEAAAEINYTKQFLWQCGLAMVVLGSLLDFAALAFASQSVIAPLGSLTLVSNVILAPMLLKETRSRRDMICTLVIVLGAAVAVLCASHDDSMPSIPEMFDYFLDLRFAFYSLCVLLCVGILRFMVWKAAKLRTLAHTDRKAAKKYEKDMKYHRFGYSAAAGIMGAQSVLFAKCTSTLFRSTIAGDDNMFVFPGSYAVLIGLGVTIFFQIRWLNSGLRLFPALYVVPVFQSFWILVSVISGMVFFQEYEGVMDSPLNALGFCAGLALTITGVYFLSQKNAASGSENDGSIKHSDEEGVTKGNSVVIDISTDPRRDSISSSSSFDQSQYPSLLPSHSPDEKEGVSVLLEGHLATPQKSYFDIIRAKKQQASTGLKQALLGQDEEKSIVLPSASMTPVRQSSKHRQEGVNQSRYLSPLPEATSPASPSLMGTASKPPPRLRARSDGDERVSLDVDNDVQRDVERDEVIGNRTHQLDIGRSQNHSLTIPDKEDHVGTSRSFSHANEFLHTPAASLNGVSYRRHRSASIGHVGDFEHTRYKLQMQRALDFGAALSALTSPKSELDDVALVQTPSPRRPQQDWADITRSAALTGPGVSAFAHALGVRNYERNIEHDSSSNDSGECDSDSGSEYDSDSDVDDDVEYEAKMPSVSVLSSPGALSVSSGLSPTDSGVGYFASPSMAQHHAASQSQPTKGSKLRR